MSLHYDKICKRWIGCRPWGNGAGRCVVTGSVFRAGWFALSGRGFLRRPPFWTFRVDCFAGDGQNQYADCSAGFFSRVLYFEVVQGRDLCTGTFYRWLRIGIPRHGCWRIRLQKREV